MVMVGVRPRVLTPVAPIAAGGGVTLLLISVELWATEIVAHLGGEFDPVTGQVEVVREFSEPWKRWERQMREGTGPRRQPPAPAMDQLFGPVGLTSVRIADNVGTHYQVKAGNTGGTGTEWRADWYFVPGVPSGANKLTLALAGEHISSTPVTLDLHQPRS
jgi:hypothetical protein